MKIKKKKANRILQKERISQRLLKNLKNRETRRKITSQPKTEKNLRQTDMSTEKENQFQSQSIELKVNTKMMPQKLRALKMAKIKNKTIKQTKKIKTKKKTRKKPITLSIKIHLTSKKRRNSRTSGRNTDTENGARAQVKHLLPSKQLSQNFLIRKSKLQMKQDSIRSKLKSIIKLKN
jgi:hypothetical protein